jgi:hypothetical protein
MRGTNVVSSQTFPLRIIPALGQVPENSVKPSNKQSCDVLHDDVAGSYLANQAGILSPKPAALAINSRSASGERNVLTWKSANDNIDRNAICFEPFGGEAGNVIVDWHLRPVLAENGLRPLVDLAERDRLEPASPLQPKVEAAYSSEEAENAVGH